jgi:lysine decarboxylase
VLHLSALGRAGVRAIDGYWCYGDDLLGAHGIYAYDPSKLVIRVTETGLTGLQVADKLRHIYNIEPEFADLRNIICSVTIADTEATLERLIGALADIAAKAGDAGPDVAPDLMAFPSRLPEAPLTLRQATVATSRRAPLDQCLGEICAESVIPYPPGIPLILPGEVIERPHLDYLQYVIAQGMIVVGPEDQTLESLRVVTRG